MKLKKGDIGSEVKKVQEFFGLNPHGVFDQKLDWAVRRWQSRNGKRETGEWEIENKNISHSSSDKLNIRHIISVNDLTAKANKNNPTDIIFDKDRHVVVVAIRGFYLDDGTDGRNDRRIYDDCHFIVTPEKIYQFRGNTDPNGFRKGSGFGRSKGMACLDEGVWHFGKGPHKGSPAFRQAVPFRVIRDGNPPYPDTGYHAINWHSGSDKSTSSLGCQTNKPKDFYEIRSILYGALETFDNPKMYLDYKDYGRARAFPYILIDEIDRRNGDYIL